METSNPLGVRCDPDELISLARAGDLATLDHACRCYGQRLLDVARRKCRNEHDARDAVQDAMVAAGQHLTDFRGEGSLEGWLVRMVTNACFRMRRGRKNNSGLHDTEVVLVSDADDPELAARRSQLAERLGEALLVLKPEDRVLLLLAEAEDWTGPQIAEKLGLTAGAVRTRLTRARARMRDALEGDLTEVV